MRLIIKGTNYTEIRYLKKGSSTDTIQFWRLPKPRKEKECGIWIDGKQVRVFEDMEKSIKIDRKTMTYELEPKTNLTGWNEK